MKKYIHFVAVSILLFAVLSAAACNNYANSILTTSSLTTTLSTSTAAYAQTTTPAIASTSSNTSSSDVSPDTLVVTISPSNPQGADFQNQYSSFVLTATADAPDSGSATVTYHFRWFENGELIAGAIQKNLTAAQIGEQGQTVKGYELKCEVNASDCCGNEYSGEATITIG